MGLRSGLGAQWCDTDETTYGVAPSLSAAPFFIWDNDTLQLNKTPKQSAGIYAQAMYPTAARRVITEYAVQGALNGDLAQRGLNRWLYRMFGSYGQSAATLTQDGTTGAYSAVHAPGILDGHTFALQAAAPAVDNGTAIPFTYTGCKISDWTITATAGDIAKLALTVEGRNELNGSWKDPLNGSVPSLQAFTAPPGGVLHWVGAQIVVGGTPTTTGGKTTISGGTIAGNLKGPMSIKQAMAMDTSRYAADVAPFRNEPLQNAVRLPTGQFTVEWLSSETYYAAYQADTATSIQYAFTGPAIGTGSDIAGLTILVPNIRIDTAPVPRSGPAVLDETVTWQGLDDRVNNVIQATYWTLDSA